MRHWHWKTLFGFCLPNNSWTRVQTTFSDDSGNKTEDNDLSMQYLRLFEDLDEIDKQTLASNRIELFFDE